MALNPPSAPLYEAKSSLNRYVGRPVDIRSNGGPMGLVNRTGGVGQGPTSLADFGFRDASLASIGWKTNGFIPEDHIMRATKDIPFTTPMKHMIMIISKDHERGAETIRRADFKMRSSLFNIPGFNFFITKRQFKPEKYEDVPLTGDIWKDFYVGGVCQTETGEEEATGSTRFAAQERNINNTIWGRCQTFHIFDQSEEEIQPKVNLWLIFKKVKILDTEPFVLTELDCGRFPPKMGSKLTNMPFQLVPYASKYHDSPPRSALLYEDEFGREGLGIPIPFGIVDDVPELTEFATDRGGNYGRNVNAIIHRPLMDVLIRPMGSYLIYGHGDMTHSEEELEGKRAS
jgi:hypothetical protein